MYSTSIIQEENLRTQSMFFKLIAFYFELTSGISCSSALMRSLPVLHFSSKNINMHQTVS